MLSVGDAHALVVSQLDRLTPRLADFAELFQWLVTAGKAFVSLSDFPIDTSTSEGQQVASVLAGVAA